VDERLQLSHVIRLSDYGRVCGQVSGGILESRVVQSHKCGVRLLCSAPFAFPHVAVCDQEEGVTGGGETPGEQEQ
jgi:hypothetical protein